MASRDNSSEGLFFICDLLFDIFFTTSKHFMLYLKSQRLCELMYGLICSEKVKK